MSSFVLRVYCSYWLQIWDVRRLSGKPLVTLAAHNKTITGNPTSVSPISEPPPELRALSAAMYIFVVTTPTFSCKGKCRRRFRAQRQGRSRGNLCIFHPFESDFEQKRSDMAKKFDELLSRSFLLDRADSAGVFGAGQVPPVPRPRHLPTRALHPRTRTRTQPRYLGTPTAALPGRYYLSAASE